MNILTDSLLNMFNTTASSILLYLPKFFAGLIVLVIGLIIASLAKDLIRMTFRYLSVEKWLEAAGLIREKEIKVWPNIFSELSRWVIIFVFLISAVDIWGIPKVSDVLSQLLLFLPNVFVAIIIGWIGLVAGRFASDIVRHGIGGVGGKEALILGNIARLSIIFFTTLIILTQLGVAAELVKILFTGIVGMLTIALGLAFGLGGQFEARDILGKLRKKLETQSESSARKSTSLK